jgi:hypothetical protein
VSSCTQLLAGVEDPDVAAYAAVDSAEVACLAAARGDCVAAVRCLGGASPCSISGACAGSSLQACVYVAAMSYTVGFDCASAGLACVTNGGRSGCGVRPCAAADAPSCSGDLLLTCDGMILHRQDCAALGAACVATPMPHCRGTGATCSTSTLDPGHPVRCEGSVLVRCYDAKEARFDCASVGENCFAARGTFFCGLGADCDPAAFTATCAGTKLSFCDDGRLAQIDCAALGFTACDATNGRCVL